MSSEKHFWCQHCGQKTEQVDVATAGQITRVTNRTIYLWVKQGRVHVNRTDGGQLKICQASLKLVTKYTAPQINHGSIDGRIKLVIRLAEQQYERDNPTIGKMAKHTGLSIWYLARLFKKNTGINFGEHLRNLRLKKAEKLLRDTVLSIKEIAAAVGYKHVSDFDHHFKSAYGMRPSEYRRSQQAKE
ncbi:MAG: helix-turn-helix transcriptional regulator [Acidobacteria bacterium]|nr:helix-turn-helix transcriptional regulator [Acidobacteriota bacterium]